MWVSFVFYVGGRICSPGVLGSTCMLSVLSKLSLTWLMFVVPKVSLRVYSWSDTVLPCIRQWVVSTLLETEFASLEVSPLGCACQLLPSIVKGKTRTASGWCLTNTDWVFQAGCGTRWMQDAGWTVQPAWCCASSSLYTAPPPDPSAAASWCSAVGNDWANVGNNVAW